ncbi:hypothetical protein [Streptomyces sp. AB3(2024)]|uniref:hypothetical protein n=1 Tax=Streptomyces sp. AB3(2024) TaxID=3317321 RepID=UPI0035A2CF9B
MPRTRHRAALLLTALSPCTLPLVPSAPRAEGAGPSHCAPVYTATPCGQLTNPLPYTYLD